MRSTIYFCALIWAIGLTAISANPAAAISQEEIERQYAVAERKLKKICVKQDALREKFIHNQSEQERLRRKVKRLKRKVGQEFYTLARRELGYDRGDADRFARGNLHSRNFNTPQEIALEARRKANLDRITAFEEGEVAAQASYTIDLTEDLKKLTDRKIAAAATLIIIDRKNSKKGTIADPDKEDAKREEIGREVAALNNELELLDGQTTDAEFEPEYSVDGGVPSHLQPTRFPHIGTRGCSGGFVAVGSDGSTMEISTNTGSDSIAIGSDSIASGSDSSIASGTEAIAIGDDSIASGSSSTAIGNNSRYTDCDDPESFQPRFGVGIGIFDGPALTFVNFSQRPLDEKGQAITINVNYPISFSGSSLGWQTAVGLELFYASQEYNGHINLPGGAPGPSSGDIRYIFGGGSIQFENHISDRFSFGIEPGLGLLNLSLDGSFVADGTIPAATLDVYGMFQANPNFFVGAGVTIVEPLGDFSGGVPGGIRFPVTAGTGRMYWIKGRYRF